MKKMPLWLGVLLASCAVLPLLGCGNGGTAAPGVSNVPVAPYYNPAPPAPVVDTMESWRKFVTQAKAAIAKPADLEAFHLESTKGQGKLQVAFMRQEVIYKSYGPTAANPAIDPKRVYVVGEFVMAAKETYFPGNFQVREYHLEFVSPNLDGKWVYADGYYTLSSYEGPIVGQPDDFYEVKMKDFTDSYLKLLFYKADLAKLPAGTPAPTSVPAPAAPAR